MLSLAALALCLAALLPGVSAAGSALGSLQHQLRSFSVDGLRALAGRLSQELQEVREPGAHGLAESDKGDLNKALRFLFDHMPEQDRNALPKEYVVVNALLALRARSLFPWAQAVPEEVFLSDVLPYANVDEPRDNWRPLFYELFKGFVSGAKSTSEAALALNKGIWDIWGIYFKADQTPEIMSPSQVIEAGYASCTGLSIFLVNACRAVGIPARVAGTPSWVASGGDGTRFNNHNWVEVWDGGKWSFTGAAEWTPQGFNVTWFYPEPVIHQIPGSYMHAVYAASWAPTPGHRNFPLAWNPDYKGVPAYDVTHAYVDVPQQRPQQQQQQQQKRRQVQ